MSNGPTIHGPLMGAAVDDLYDGFKDDAERRAAEKGRAQAGFVHHLLQQAYTAGVRDGFVQGVAAAADGGGK